MSTMLNEVVSSIGADNLINSTFPPAMSWGVTYAGGSGLIKRGTVLSLNGNKMACVYGADGLKTAANQTVTSHAASVTVESGCDVSTVQVFKKDATTAYTLTTDYTLSLSGTTLTVTLVDGGAAYSDTALDVTYSLDSESVAEPYAVATDDIDTGADSSAAIFGTAYKTGNFNRNHLIAARPIDAVAEEQLREKGIFMNDSKEVKINYGV